MYLSPGTMAIEYILNLFKIHKWTVIPFLEECFKNTLLEPYTYCNKDTQNVYLTQ